MANDKPAGASAPAAAKQPESSPDVMYQLENRTRDVYRFAHERTVQRDGAARHQLVFDHTKDLVLGDQADKTLPPGVVRNPRCPDPVQQVSQTALDAMTPPNRRFLDSLVAEGKIEMRRLG